MFVVYLQPFDDELRTVWILAERLLEQMCPEGVSESVKSLLAGFQFFGGHFVPIGLFDERELSFLPEAAAGEISTALDRLVGGDLDGSLSAACNTVDKAVFAITDPVPNGSFAQKAKTGGSSHCAPGSTRRPRLET